MNALAASITVAGITYLGRVARGKNMDITLVVGLGALAISLAVLEQINETLGKQFALLVIVATLLAHWTIIVEKLGFK